MESGCLFARYLCRSFRKIICTVEMRLFILYILRTCSILAILTLFIYCILFGSLQWNDFVDRCMVLLSFMKIYYICFRKKLKRIGSFGFILTKTK